MRSKEHYTAQFLYGWIYQITLGHHGYHLEIWNPAGREYRRPMAFGQYEEAVEFAQSLIVLADNASHEVINKENSTRFEQLIRQLICIECDDCIYKEWHIKSYEDSDNNWDLYALDPVTGKAKICLKRQIYLQEAITQLKAQIDVTEAIALSAGNAG